MPVVSSDKQGNIVATFTLLERGLIIAGTLLPSLVSVPFFVCPLVQGELLYRDILAFGGIVCIAAGFLIRNECYMFHFEYDKDIFKKVFPSGREFCARWIDLRTASATYLVFSEGRRVALSLTDQIFPVRGWEAVATGIRLARSENGVRYFEPQDEPYRDVPLNRTYNPDGSVIPPPYS